MTAYLKVLLLRWMRGHAGLEAFAGALFAPLAFTAATYVLAVSRYSIVAAPDSPSQHHKVVTTTVILFAAIAAAFAFTHLMANAINIEKQHNRSVLLRTSGLSGTRATLTYLAASVVLGALLVPTSLVGPWVMTATLGSPMTPISFVLTFMVLILALSPLVIASQFFVAHPFAMVLSFSIAFFSACFFAGYLSIQQYQANLHDFLVIVAVWVLGSAILLVAVALDSRRRRRAWT